MIGPDDIADWIRDQNPADGLSGETAAHAVKIVPDPDTPAGQIVAAPDRLVAVTISGGGSTLRERTFDQISCQILTRGLSGVDLDALVLAGAVDDLLMGAVPPILMGGHRVVSVNYVGGPPGFVSRDDGRRALFSCNYMLQTGRSVF